MAETRKLAVAETAVLELFEQFVEAVAQGLLALPQVAKRVALLALLALLSLMTLLPLSALRSALGAAPALILTPGGRCGRANPAATGPGPKRKT